MSSKNRRFNIKNSLYFLLPFFILAFAACSDQNNNDFGVLTLTAEPASLPADGYSQSIIQAELSPVNGEEVRDRTKVRFTIVSGEGRIDSSSETRDGLAFARLTASPNPGTARIRAESNGNIAEITVNYENRNPAHIELAAESPSPGTLSLSGTGGHTTSRLFFNVSDIYGEPVGDGHRVDFKIQSGPGGGEVVEPASATTRNGQVSTMLRSGNRSGPVSIRASYHDNATISAPVTQVVINSGPPVGEEFGIFPDVFNIAGLVEANLNSNITVNVGDVYGNPVPEGTIVAFKTYNTGGQISPATDGTTAGEAGAELRSSGTYAQPANGFVSVTAETEGGSTTHVRTIAVDPGDAKIMFVGTSGGGVYKSTNAGSSWENVSRTSEHNNLGQNYIDPYINDICINPDNSEAIYVATGYEGKGNIYRSLNGGMTWNSNNNPAEWGGLLHIGSAVLTVLCDNGSEYVWAGTRNEGIVISRDGTSFQDGNQIRRVFLGTERTVRDIEKASGTGATAVLYAATPTGVYKSVNGGFAWTRKTNFKGDNITSVAVHPADPATLYAGTQEYGVWYSTNGGDTWTQYIDGLGKGLKATRPVADAGNAGSGLMSDVQIGKTTKTENWTVVYDENEDRWVVTGTTSGRQKAFGITGESYVSDNGEVGFRVLQGSQPFEDGDAFRFKTFRDPGMNINDLQVYHSVESRSYYLYAITYAFGAQDYQPVGNVYSVAISGLSYRPTGGWREANLNLSEIDSPVSSMDGLLYAPHTMAVDNPLDSSRLFIGGQGINFHKAVNGLTSGNPVWEESKSGLTNRIMARIPILFSGQATMFVQEISQDRLVEMVDDEEVISWRVIYHVYIGDRNGNPPVSGSTFSVRRDYNQLLFVEYLDTLSHTGSWNDPSDPNPYIIEEIIEDGKEGFFIFEFLGEGYSPQRQVFPYSFAIENSDR